MQTLLFHLFTQVFLLISNLSDFIQFSHSLNILLFFIPVGIVYMQIHYMCLINTSEPKRI